MPRTKGRYALKSNSSHLVAKVFFLAVRLQLIPFDRKAGWQRRLRSGWILSPVRRIAPGRRTLQALDFQKPSAASICRDSRPDGCSSDIEEVPNRARATKQTLNENIANLGGIAAVYDDYRDGDKEEPAASSFSGDQQFFLAWGQQNAGKPTEAVLRQQVLTDVHSPDEYSASIARNLGAWYAAFSVKPGDKLYLAPSDCVRVW